MNGRQRIELGAEPYKICSGGFAPHTPGSSSRRAECFLIEEIAPAADSLTQRQINDAVIDKRCERDLADGTHYQESEKACDDAAVNGKAAGSRIQNALDVSKGRKSNEI